VSTGQKSDDEYSEMEKKRKRKNGVPAPADETTAFSIALASMEI